LGCSNPFKKTPPSENGVEDPEKNGEDPGEDPGDTPGDGSSAIDPTDNRLTADVTLVPQKAAAAITFAVIRQGDLWLGIDSTRLWRQTNSGDVADIVWAPDGHALAFLTTPTLDAYTRNLYTLVPGSAPVLIDQEVIAFYAWQNNRGFLWNPDSSQLAYGKAGASQIRVVGPGEAKGAFLVDSQLEQGPYWLSADCLVYSSAEERPSLVIVNTMGDIIKTIPDTAAPYPITGGILAASGEYDPDGIMFSFYYTGLVHTGIDGANLSRVHDENPDFSLIAWNPQEAARPEDAKYFAISNADTLFLQKYAGQTKAYPHKVDLLTQDVYLTFSEFSYPFWFAWAPDGKSLAALPFRFSQAGGFGEQAGKWDLVLVDRAGNSQTLLENIYSVSGNEHPVPFKIMPLNWSPTGSHINYLVERNGGGYNLWQIKIADQSISLFLENSGLPEYRP
jgi:dipeptidyl aminopeptidase/acylaminoacyl peptidase